MEIRHEAARKAIHVALAVLPAAAWILTPAAPWLVRSTLLLLALAAFVFDRLRRRPGRVREWTSAAVGPLIRSAEENRILGSTFYFLSLAISFVFFPRTLALAAMGFLIVGDTAAALAGRAWGRTRLRSGRTLEGSLACLGGCVMVTAMVKALDPAPPYSILLGGAAAGTIGELVSNGDTDNLAIPLFSGAVMTLLSRSL
jgi:dolichol kinase